MRPCQIAAKEKRRKIYDLRRENYSWDEIGKMLGFEAATCEKYFRAAVKKDGLPAFESPDAYGKQNTLEHREPEAAAAVIAGAMAAGALDDPKYRELREACKQAGMKPSLVTALIKRLSVGNYSPVMAEGRRLTIAQVTEELERKTALVLGYIDEFSVSQAGLKDLSIAANILIEKHQLLTNKPTQIIDFNSRQQINVLMPMMLAEAKRRGIEIPGEAVRVDGPR